MTDDQSALGRLIVVIGRPDVISVIGRSVARNLEGLIVETGRFDDMVTTGPLPLGDQPTTEQLRRLFLRWSAAIATAETYTAEGFDAVIVDSDAAERLDDFLDLVSPTPIRLVHVDPPAGFAGPGIAVSPVADAGGVAAVIIERLDDALVGEVGDED